MMTMPRVIAAIAGSIDSASAMFVRGPAAYTVTCPGCWRIWRIRKCAASSVSGLPRGMPSGSDGFGDGFA